MRSLDMRWIGLLVLAGLLASCGGSLDATPVPPTATQQAPVEEPTEGPGAAELAASESGEETMPFELSSTAFSQGSEIPTQFSCDGEDISPPLQWSQPPAGAVALALIMDDPDAPAGTWDHWLLFNLSAEAGGLDPGVEPLERLPNGSVHGANSWGRIGYGGPCPPSGTHRYFFKLYALDQPLDLPVGANKAEVLAAMEGHVLEQAELMGTYER